MSPSTTIDLNNPTVVATLSNEIEAAIVANYLVNQGIEARIAGSTATGGMWAQALEIQVAVRADDRERAQALLAENRSTAPRHSSRSRLVIWFLLLAPPAVVMLTETSYSVWLILLFGIVSGYGFWRLMQRRHGLLESGDE